MLRSIFSLIQRIIDSSDKQYNNTKSKAVIYCFVNNSESGLNTNLQMEGKLRNKIKSLECIEAASVQTGRLERKTERQFSIETEQGDMVTCKHDIDINIVPKENRVTFSNNIESKPDEEQKNDVERSEIQPNVRDLIMNFPKQRVEMFTKGQDQISLLLKQIQKMKTGLERLQEIALQFNCSDRFAEDVNYLIHSIKPYLRNKKHNGDVNDVSTK